MRWGELLYRPRLNREGLRQLAALLADAGRIQREQADTAVETTVQRLARHFGKQVLQIQRCRRGVWAIESPPTESLSGGKGVSPP